MKLSLMTLALPFCFVANLHAEELIVRTGGDIQKVVNRASDGDTVLVEPGRYIQSIYIDKQDITFRGLSRDGRHAELDGEMRLNDGIIASGHGTVIEGFVVRGYKGNGIMTQGANNFVIRDNTVHGAFYGIFPQYGKNGLVKGNTVTGAEDAGIYVGMSDHIDVIDNIAHGNVMGLEFENTRHALMARNKVYNNSTGIVLSLIPGLPVKDAFDQVVRDNVIRDNNLKNFAPASSIAASVPEGVGIIVVGTDDVTIENNLIENNLTAGAFVVDMFTFGLASDPKVDPYSDRIRIMENDWRNNGTAPIGMLGEMLTATGKTGLEIVSSGKDQGSCHVHRDGVDTLGTENWTVCEPGMSKADYATAMMPAPAEAPIYTAEQKGRFTYLAVCTGCHTYGSVLHGPSMQSVKALYGDDVDALVEYIANPVRKRRDFPEMPGQHYLGEETLEAIANYVLFELNQ
jgi:parallel beta-helix repeat protein